MSEAKADRPLESQSPERTSEQPVLPGAVPQQRTPEQAKADLVADWRAEKLAKENESKAQFCNIGPIQRRIRNLSGLGFLILSIALSLLAIYVDSSPLLRLVLFIPYWFAFLCLFQASEKVCVLHAAQGTCNLDQGSERIADEALASKMRVKATWVYTKATFSAVFWVLLAAVLHRKLFGWGP